MTPFSGPKYHENSDRCGDKQGCVYCGKPIKDEVSAPMARVLDGGARFATAEEAHRNDLDQASDMGWFPVGPDCAKRLRKAGVYLSK